MTGRTSIPDCIFCKEIYPYKLVLGHEMVDVWKKKQKLYYLKLS